MNLATVSADVSYSKGFASAPLAKTSENSYIIGMAMVFMALESESRKVGDGRRAGGKSLTSMKGGIWGSNQGPVLREDISLF